MNNCTSDQLEALLNFLDDNKEFARGLLRSADGRLRAKRLRQELSQLLNSLGGSIKTVQQWQKVTENTSPKKNAAANRRSAAATGGGQGSQPLASWEMRVLSIMGEGFGAPETTARVPIFPSINFEHEVASYGALLEERAGSSSAPQLADAYLIFPAYGATLHHRVWNSGRVPLLHHLKTQASNAQLQEIPCVLRHDAIVSMV